MFLYAKRSLSCFFYLKQFRIHSSSYTTAKNLDLSGIFPPIPTPFKPDDGSICFEKLRNNFVKWNKIPFKGYLIQGSNGEYVYLCASERIEMIKKGKEFIDNNKLLIAGAGCETTKETVLMCNKMAEAGADAAMVVTPCYYKSGMKDDALCRHFEEVANESEIPIILYNVPANTGVDMSVEAVGKLASHKNIIGMKESNADITKIGSILHATRKENFQLLCGSAGFLLASLHLGCVGGVCALANVLGEKVCLLYQHFLDDKKEEAKLLQQNLIHPNTAVTKQFGVPGLKEIMDQKGYYGGPTRSPLLKLNDSDSKKLQIIFKNAGYL